MKKTIDFFATYFLPVIVIGTVVVCCVLFLLENLPYDNDSIDVNFSREKVVIGNKYLMSDELGKKITFDNEIKGTTGYVEFEVKSRVDGKVKYEVILLNEKSDSDIDLKFVKVYLTDSNDKAFKNYEVSNLPTYYDLRISESDASGKLLYSGHLKNKGSQKFRLRMWVSDTHEIIAQDKMFAVNLKVNVK